MRRRLMQLLPFLFATASCGSEAGRLEVTVRSELCSGSGDAELGEVAILIGSTEIDLNDPPEFAAHFDGCADESDGVIFEQSFVPPDGEHQLFVVAGLKRGDEVGTVDGCLHELIKPLPSSSVPCLFASRTVYTAPHSETTIELSLREDCLLPTVCVSFCLDDTCR